MQTLYVEDFSCIDRAELEVGRVTLLVGPQASGKSVISKLLYFCINALTEQYLSLDDQKSVSAYRADLADMFRETFPVGAWGKKRFHIEYTAGKYSISISRSVLRSGVDSVRVDFSDFFLEHYNQNLLQVQKLFSRADGSDAEATPGFDYGLYRVRRESRRRLARELAENFVTQQLFVPAGRSFFTSIGKAVAAFEQGGLLDPVTVRFGRLFAALREQQGTRPYDLRGSATVDAARKHVGLALFGGNIKFDRKKEYVETSDGRKVPFSALSSGQQELLPLWMALEYVLNFPDSSLVYIEEPEAHLFPSSQSVLVEYLATVSNANGKSMFLTTHSPYVLSKMNTLLKAGHLGSSLGRVRQARVDKVVSRRAWLNPKTTRAYAIIDRKLVSILEGDGSIDGAYLDSVSGKIDEQYSSLLEIEYSSRRRRDLDVELRDEADG